MDKSITDIASPGIDKSVILSKSGIYSDVISVITRYFSTGENRDIYFIGKKNKK